MRKGFDGLAALVQQRLRQDPFGGAVYAFRGRRGDLVKLQWWDGQGLVLHAKRLERVSCPPAQRPRRHRAYHLAPGRRVGLRQPQDAPRHRPGRDGLGGLPSVAFRSWRPALRHPRPDVAGERHDRCEEHKACGPHQPGRAGVRLHLRYGRRLAAHYHARGCRPRRTRRQVSALRRWRPALPARGRRRLARVRDVSRCHGRPQPRRTRPPARMVWRPLSHIPQVNR
ncbi:hypothetical protein BRX36_21115 [Sphingomonas sp. S-NIH.Pt1_0416]|nr:hypothetical protein BRX36_21115 [Sphingomonas sp. S-NIH.Pt1_0416]